MRTTWFSNKLIKSICNYSMTSSSSTQLYKVFVYGTLKKGEPNHYWFSKEKSGYYNYVCDAKTTEKYPLIIATKYNIPFVLYSPGNGKQVYGELYEVDEKVFADLDILEDHPNFYEREQIECQCLSDNNVIKAWMYFIKKFKPSLLNNTNYESYSNNGEHGLKYVDSDDVIDLRI